MFDVRFFEFSKRENSTARPNLSGGVVLSCVLKDKTTLNNPVISVDLGTGGNPPEWNYCYLFGKYYFINDWTADNLLWSASCTVDTLATYKDDILASTQYVSYSSVQGDSWLPDTRIPVLRSTTVSSSSTALPFFLNGGYYILSYIGIDSSGLVALGKSSLDSLITNISSQDMDILINDIVDDIDYDWTQGAEGGMYYWSRAMTQNDILGRAYQTAPSCLRSCIWIPFQINSLGWTRIYLGNYDTGVSGQAVSGEPISGSCSVSIPWHFSDWRRSTCEQVYLYLPLVGMVSVSSDNLTHTNSITINYSYTVTDGTVAFQVVSGGEIIGSYGGSCAVNYPLGVNQQASAGQVTQAMMQGLTQTVSAGITGNVGGAIMGLVNASYSAMDAALTTHPSCVGGIGGGAGSGLSRSVVCYTVAHDTIITPAEMQNTLGLPTMKPLQLSSCSGYCQCANAHLSCSASLEELNALSTIMNSGFYIE